VEHDTLAAVGQTLLAELRDKARRLGLQRRHQHAPRPVPRNLGQRVENRARLVKRGERGIVLHGVSLLWLPPVVQEVSARLVA